MNLLASPASSLIDPFQSHIDLRFTFQITGKKGNMASTPNTSRRKASKRKRAGLKKSRLVRRKTTLGSPRTTLTRKTGISKHKDRSSKNPKRHDARRALKYAKVTLLPPSMKPLEEVCGRLRPSHLLLLAASRTVYYLGSWFANLTFRTVSNKRPSRKIMSSYQREMSTSLVIAVARRRSLNGLYT